MYAAPTQFGGCCATGPVYAAMVPAPATPTMTGMTGMAGMGMKGMNMTAADPAPATAAGKQVKLTGTLVCGKCNLHQAKKCTNVLRVKDGTKTVNYWLADKGNGETYHEGVCGGGTVEHVTVTGTLTEKDGKKVVTPTKVDVKK
jgi:hypothetical protein